MTDLVFTGERFLPDCPGEIWLEHWHRYHFATALARDRRVLDVASGEGYGSALLARTARAVVGLDAALDAVAHAQLAYADRRNLRFIGGDCARLPFPDAAFDLVVSFETIEHIETQREFLAEVRRVLTPDGVLLLSSPNKAEYTDRRGYANPFHVAELYREELHSLLDEFFPHSAWYGQSIGFCSTIALEGAAADAGGELVKPGLAAQSTPGPIENPKEPLYYLVGCALSPAPLRALDKSFSVLGDPADAVYRDYQDTYRKFVAASEAVAIFRERETTHGAELDQARRAAQVSLDAAQVSLDSTVARLAAVEGERDRALSESGASRSALAALQSGFDVLQGKHAALQAKQQATSEETTRLQTQLADLQSLTANLGAASHAAQQFALRLTAALHEANARYQAALDAAHRAHEQLAVTADQAEQRHRDALAALSADVEGLRQAAVLQQAELDRRAGWRWRLRWPRGRG